MSFLDSVSERMNAQVQPFYHASTHTLSYVVYDKVGGHAAVIDPALDFVAHSGATWTAFADEQIAFLEQHQLTLEWILETHAHADHISASQYIKKRCGGRLAIGKGILQVQKTFDPVFGTESQREDFDHLFEDQERFAIGSLTGEVMATPGHTDDSVTYLIEGNAFVGDTLFMPDGGTARCDFPGGDASRLFNSIQKLHSLPDETRIWVCHDYQPNDRTLAYMTTVLDSKLKNIHVNQSTQQEEFVAIRQARDKTLDLPALIYPSVQVNIRGGRLPKADENGQQHIKIPLDIRNKAL